MGREGNLKTKFGLGITKLKKKKPETLEFNSKEKNTHSKRVYTLPPSTGSCLALCLSPAGQRHLCSFPASRGLRDFTEHPDSDAQVIVSQAWV